jgi:hypothetical protein
VLRDNGFGKLGFNSLALLYFTFGVCAFFASPVVKILGSKYSMFVGSMCYTFYVGSFILAALRSSTHPSMSKIVVQVAVMLTAALNGFGASILWVAQGNYLAKCATNENKGKFNSIFWAFYMASYVLGNILTTFVITNVNLVQFYIIMTTICFLASCFFLFLKPAESHPAQESTVDTAEDGSLLTNEAS